MSESFEQKLRRAFNAIKGTNIPDMPEEVLELNQEINMRYPNTQNMVRIIGKNALLAADVLRIANSPAMRPTEPIKSIAQAVAILGTVNLKNMVLASALRQVFGNAAGIKEVLEHSADVAFCMAELANHVYGVTPDEAYLCGLFLNCGAFLLLSKDKSYQDTFFQAISLPQQSILKEEARFGTNHTVVGLLLAKKWQLSTELTQAIYDHHATDCNHITNEKVRLLVALSKVANGIIAEISVGAYIGSEVMQEQKLGLEMLMLDDGALRDARMALQTYSTHGTH